MADCDYVLCPNCGEKLVVKFPAVAYLMVSDNGLGFEFNTIYKDKEGDFIIDCICGWSWDGSDPEELISALLD